MALPSLSSQGIQTTGYGYTPLAPSNTMGTLGVISGVGSAIAGIGSAYAQSTQYKIQEMQARTNEALSKMQGNKASLDLLKDFNKTMASNAVISAAQGRTGPTVSAVSSAAESQYNWDSDFTKLSSDIEAKGYSAQAKQYDIASTTSLIGGALSSIGGASSNVGYNLYSIGGSTKGKE